MLDISLKYCIAKEISILYCIGKTFKGANPYMNYQASTLTQKYTGPVGPVTT